MLRDEGPLSPLAGCTDVYVNLNFGTLEGKALPEPLAARRAARRSGCGIPRSHRRPRDLHRDPTLPARPQAAPDARRGVPRGRRRADPESRDDRRQHRQRLARRRHAARSRRGRSDPRPRQRRREAARALRCLLHGIPQDRDAARRADRSRSRSRRSPAGSGSARSARARRRRSRRSSWRPSSGRPCASRSAASRRPSSGCRGPKALLAAGGSIADARRVARREIRPIDDLRSTAEYRRRVAGQPPRAVLAGAAREDRP